MRLPTIGTRAAANAAPANGGAAEDGAPRHHVVAARHEFMNAFGDLARGKRNWQLVAFALVGVVALLAATDLRLAATSRVVPYVVQVDRLGQVAAVGAAERMAAPDERLVASQLAQFVRAVRTVLPAAAAPAEAETIRRAYAFAAPDAAAFLNAHFADPRHDPRVLGLRLTRQVDVTGVLRVPKSDVWRLRWTETDRPTAPGGAVGDAARVTAWEGYVTVALVPPTTAETVQDNPLGVYVTSISWTELADGPATTSPTRNGPAAVDADDTAHDPTHDTAHDTGVVP